MTDQIETLQEVHPVFDPREILTREEASQQQACKEILH